MNQKNTEENKNTESNKNSNKNTEVNKGSVSNHNSEKFKNQLSNKQTQKSQDQTKKQDKNNIRKKKSRDRFENEIPKNDFSIAAHRIILEQINSINLLLNMADENIEETSAEEKNIYEKKLKTLYNDLWELDKKAN